MSLCQLKSASVMGSIIGFKNSLKSAGVAFECKIFSICKSHQTAKSELNQLAKSIASLGCIQVPTF
jgi:hypothetical protein